MRSLTRRWVLTSLAAPALLALTGEASAALHLVLTSTAHAPIGGGDGAFSTLVRQAFARIGESVEFDAPGAERSLREVAAGRAAADGPRVESIAEAYPTLRRVPEALVDYRFVAFTRALSGPVTGWDWAEDRDVAIVRGWKILERNVRARSLLPVRDARLLFNLLARDRIDVAVHEEMIGRALAAEVGVPGLRVLDPPFAVRPMYLYLHERHESLVVPLTEALAGMKADGSGRAALDRSLGPGVVDATPGLAAHWSAR